MTSTQRKRGERLIASVLLCVFVTAPLVDLSLPLRVQAAATVGGTIDYSQGTVGGLSGQPSAVSTGENGRYGDSASDPGNFTSTAKDTPGTGTFPDGSTGDTQAGAGMNFSENLGAPKIDPKDPYGPMGAQCGSGFQGCDYAATGGSPAGGASGGGGGATGAISGSGMPVQDRALIQLTRQVQADIKKIQANTVKIQGNTKKSAAMNTISAKKLGSLEKKEYILDGILHGIVKKLLQQIVKSALKWVASGFKGSPMFVTNPQQFLLSAGDQAAKEFIYGSGLNSSCNPTSLRTAMDQYYRSRSGRSGYQQGQCSLTGSASGLTGGLGGSFGAAGGLGGWFQTLSNPANSPFGSFLYGQEQLGNQISSRQYTEKMKWDWGNGFLPKENCRTVGEQQVCDTTTPGDTIAQATNFDLSVGKRELIQADELNEMISALMSQLANQALTAAGGLFNLGGGSSQSGGYTSSLNNTSAQKETCKGLSYLDQIGTQNCDGQTDGTNNTNASNAESGATISIVSGAINSEIAYQEMNQQVSVAVNATLARASGCSTGSTVVQALTTIQSAADTTITQSNATVQALLAIQTQYDSGTDAAQSAATGNYNALATAGALHSDVYNASFQLIIDNVLANITALESQIGSCASGGNN